MSDDVKMTYERLLSLFFDLTSASRLIQNIREFSQEITEL